MREDELDSPEIEEDGRPDDGDCPEEQERGPIQGAVEDTPNGEGECDVLADATVGDTPDEEGESDLFVEETVDDTPDEDQSEPIPETVADPAPRARGKKLWLLPIAAIALLLGLGGWLYFGLLRYEPTALAHVPAGSNIAIRADAAKVLLFGPVRTHIWPVLFERSQESEEGARLERIEEETGVSIPTNLRELVVASVDGTAWVAIVGGRIEPGRFVEGLHRVLEEEGVTSWRKEGDQLVHESGARIAQAEDGTLILGTHRDIVEAALPRSESDAQLPVPADGAIGFRVSQVAVKHALKAIPESIPVDPLRTVDEVSGSVELAEQPIVTLEALPKSTTSPAELATELNGMFSKLGLLLLVVPHDLYGGKKAISDVQVTAKERTVQVSTTWPRKPIDEGLALLAKTLRGGKRTESP